MSVFIMRRGLALPKYVWNRYSIAYTETAGSSATVSRTYSYSKMAASAYTRSGTTFTLTSPTSTTFENITSGKYLVNVANSSSTATSGTTLYKVTNNAGRTKNLSTSGTTSTYLQQNVYSNRSAYYASYAYVNQSSGKIAYGGITQTTIGALASVSNVYLPYTWFPEFNSGSDFPDSRTSGYLVTKVDTSGLAGAYINIYAKTISVATSSTLNLTYTPYTAKTSAGTLIDTVSDNDISAYPTNGVQDGYWYILQS